MLDGRGARLPGDAWGRVSFASGDFGLELVVVWRTLKPNAEGSPTG